MVENLQMYKKPVYLSAIYINNKFIGYRCNNYYMDKDIYNSIRNITKEDAERNVINFIKHSFYIDMKYISEKNKKKYIKINRSFFSNIKYSEVSYKILHFDEEIRKLKLLKIISKMK